jgi:hypothetical protein
MKRLPAAAFFCAAALLAAQERSDVKLYVAPAQGGPADAREFFDTNIPAEIRGAHYTVAESPDGADYLVAMNITEETGEDSETPWLFSLVVTKALDAAPLVEFAWGYTDVEEMYAWNLYLLYNALANVPMTNAGGQTLLAPGTAPPVRKRDRRFFIGLRAGAAFPGYHLQSGAGYVSGYSSGLSGEAALVAELRLFRFLGFQAEGDFIYEAFDAPGTDFPADTYTSMSFMFPLLVKAPLRFGRFTLSFYAGAYYLLILWDAQKKPGSSEGTESAEVRMTLPFGFALGTDLAFQIGPGELFADFRYGRDLGGTDLGDGRLYIRDRISVGMGYKFGF